MNKNSNDIAAQGGLVPLHPPTSRNDEALEIDIGDYIICVGDLQVGEVFVEADPSHPGDRAYTVEHWCLFSNYPAPGPHNERQAMTFAYRTGAYASAADFLTRMRSIPGVRYIMASCQERSL